MDADFDRDEAGWSDACRAITNAADVPWVLLSAGVDFDTFAPQVRIACEQGASGFLAGRAIWKEVAQLDDAARANYVETTVVQRMNQLCAYAEAGQSWCRFFHIVATDADWHKSYQALPL